jgi:hypothetical protein
MYEQSSAVPKFRYSSQKYCCKVEAIGKFVCSSKTGYPVLLSNLLLQETWLPTHSR